MASNLYEVLSLDKGAAPEDVRKAYRKKALSTHPDRLPPNASEAERQAANEQFRLVNNAYEVLNDAKNRKLYDRHGVWPPPTTNATASKAGPSSNAQYDAGFDWNDVEYVHDFHFADPFDTFNSFFQDVHGQMYDDHWFVEEPVFPPMRPMPMFLSPFATHHRGPLFGPPASSFGIPFGRNPLIDMMHRGMGGSNIRSYSSVPQTMSPGGEWVSQSQTTRMANGRTETITERRDAQGHEYIIYSSPEGERHTYDGVDQPHLSTTYLRPSPSHPPAMAVPPYPSGYNYALDYDTLGSVYGPRYPDYATRYHVPVSSPYAPPPPPPQPHAVQYGQASAEDESLRITELERRLVDWESSHGHRRDNEHRQSPTPSRSRESTRESTAEGAEEYAGAGTRRSPVDLTESPPPPTSAMPPLPPHRNASSSRDRDVPARPSRHESQSGRDKRHNAKR